MIVNVNSTVEHVMLFKIGIMINVNLSVKSIVHVKKIIGKILARALVRIVGI